MNQIETLMRQMEAKINSLQESITAKDTEIAELKQWQDEAVRLTSEVQKMYAIDLEQQAEIKRLRDALLWLKENRTPDRAMIEVFIDKTLSPAPVTEGPKEDENGLLPCLMLKPLDLSSLPAKYPECPLTGCYFDVESWERGKFHPIVYFRTPLDCIDLGEFDSRELAWTAIETWRNGELVKHFIPKT